MAAETRHGNRGASFSVTSATLLVLDEDVLGELGSYVFKDTPEH